MFYSSIMDIRRLDGYYENGLFFGPIFMKYRHRELQRYIGGHQTPLTAHPVFTKLAHFLGNETHYFYPDRVPTEEQIHRSWRTLMERCPKCRKKHLRAKREGRPYRYSVSDKLISRISRRGTPSKERRRHP